MSFFPGEVRWSPSKAPGIMDPVQMPASVMGNKTPKMGMLNKLDYGKLGKILGIGGGVMGMLGQFGAFDSGEDVLTESKGRELIQSAGQRAYRNIFQQTARAKGDVASQYAARGLGSSGAVIGDIAGTEMQAAEAMGVTESALNEQLLGLLQYLDQKKMAEQQQQRGLFGDIAELGFMLPFIL